VEAWLARRASGGGPRTGGGGKSAEAEGGTDEEDRQLQRAIAGLLLSLQLPMELLAAEGDDGAQGADQLLGVALPRVEYLQVVVHLAEPGGGVLLQNSLQKGVSLPRQGLGGLSGIEGVGVEGEPVGCDIPLTAGQVQPELGQPHPSVLIRWIHVRSRSSIRSALGPMGREQRVGEAATSS
jgi:hypothetical protein